MDASPPPDASGPPLLSHDPESVPVARRERLPEWVVRLGVLAFACSLFLPNVGSFGLWDPWETHYGEVTRYMVETHDWVHPWWGYKGEKLGTEEGPGEHFYSKPILIFWMEAATIRVFGLSEFSIRFPVALIAIASVFAVYLCFSQILGRRKGLLAALVLATCPQFYLLARQAQTDMPFVGTLTIALSFFCTAMFGQRRHSTDRGTWALLAGTLLFVLALVLPQLGIISADVRHPVPVGPDGNASFGDRWRLTGLWQAVTYLVVLVPVLMSMVAPAAKVWRENGGAFTAAFRDDLRRKCYLWVFYAFCALSLMSKGLLGFALPGVIIFMYLLLTGEWGLLVQRHAGGWRGRAELIRGLLIFLCVGLPWYVALLSGPEGSAFWNRFIIHDHFNRLGEGVHEIDDGTFEHFIKWLGFGMWPWVALVPLALLAMARYRLADRSPENRLRLFLFLWLMLSYTLFTLSSTKFHHYIFPALPPLAILIGWALHDVASDRTWLGRILVGIGVGLFALVGWDLLRDPQHLRNLYTYKYDRELPSYEQMPLDPDQPVVFTPSEAKDWEPEQTWSQGDFYKHTPEGLHSLLEVGAFRYDRWIKLVLALGLLAFGLMLFAGTARIAGMALLGLLSVAMAAWGVNYYMATLSPHWSQKYLFERYYDTCTRAPNSRDIEESFAPMIADSPALMDYFAPDGKRVCQEEVVSWLLTWRGETFYSNNAIRPIQKENTQFQPYLEQINKGARYYVHIERTRAKSFKGRADSFLKKLDKNPWFAGIQEYKVTLEHNENYWFVLLKADPVCKAGFNKDRIGRCLRG